MNIEKVYQSVIKAYHLMDLPMNNNIEHTDLILSLCVFFFSKFKYKLSGISHKEEIIKYVNYILSLSNSKFVISDSINKEEFVTISLYLFEEFDIINSFIDMLKEYENESVRINFGAMIRFVTPTVNKESDNLQSEIKTQSKSALEGYSKLNYVIKNIKKQIDLLINMIYKLSLIQSNSKINIEENIVLSNSNLFKQFYFDYFQITNEVLNHYLQNIPTIVDLLEPCYDFLQSKYQILLQNISKAILNDKYNRENKNIKIRTIQNIFCLKLICQNNFLEKFKIFINTLEEKLTRNFAVIKERYDDLINSDKVSNMMTTLAEQLEKFITSNEKSINCLLCSFDEGDNCNKEIELLNQFAHSKNDSTLIKVYQDILFLNNGINSIFSNSKNDIYNYLNANSLQVKEKYMIYNYTK